MPTRADSHGAVCQKIRGDDPARRRATRGRAARSATAHA